MTDSRWPCCGLLVPGLDSGAAWCAAAQEKPDKIRSTTPTTTRAASCSRSSAGWKRDLAADGIEVEWVLSAGSNKANEFLRSDAIDFGSTAGAAALLAKANGSAIQTVYIYSKPEWTALVVPKDSEITKVEELKGKKIAATKGTDPYFFLLRSLNSVGLSASDVEVVNSSTRTARRRSSGATSMPGRVSIRSWPNRARSRLEAALPQHRLQQLGLPERAPGVPREVPGLRDPRADAV